MPDEQPTPSPRKEDHHTTAKSSSSSPTPKITSQSGRSRTSAASSANSLYKTPSPHSRAPASSTAPQLASPFKEVLEIDAALTVAIQKIKDKTAINPDDRIPVSIGGGENDEAPDPWEESEDFALGSISTSMVGPAGLEPATYRL
jgi:hypothetical protein